MNKNLMPLKIEDWTIVTAAEAGVVTDDSSKRFVIGTYENAPVRTSYIVHNGAPHYVETNNSIYGLGEPRKLPPEPAPLTPMQNQAVAVAKKTIVDEVSKGGDLGPLGRRMLDDSAQATAFIVVQALIKAHLLV